MKKYRKMTKTNIIRNLSAFMLLCLLFQAGCLVGPDYKPQDANAPAGWVGTKNTTSPDAMLLKWWTEFNDANLTSLIERAMKSNLDLKQAEERIRQARASRGVAAAGFWPTADVTGSSTRNHTPTSGAVPASDGKPVSGGSGRSVGAGYFRRHQTQYRVGRCRYSCGN